MADQKVEDFFCGLKKGREFFLTPPINRRLELKPFPAIPWFPIIFPSFPHREILEEAKALKSMFVPHRSDETHKGWKSLCLHGISATKTNNYDDYGYKNERTVPYQWTEIAAKCPIATNYFRRIFPSTHYRRIRFMLLEAGGYVLPHKDRDNRMLGPLALSLNAPEGCLYGLKKHGIIPIKAGRGYLVDISNIHCLWNRSNEDRYHILVEMNPGRKFNEYIQILYKSFCSINPPNLVYQLNKKIFKSYLL